ncbi:hypothetical protein BY458DRAFT_502375 [Sporodiniella umbellata]|nr:hypothetical protein BY458DRAFT_502375 [Sporodiniella umbellata]
MHPFHECPLRSSSLLITNKEKIIVTATDELFEILGYEEPNRLLGKSLDILHPMKKGPSYLFKHASSGYVSFDVCVHRDPLKCTDELDYWLIRPTHTKSQQRNITGPTTLLRLSPFGTIENAYPSVDFPQVHHQLRHRPIMSFIHESDVRKVCHRLNQIRYKTHCTLRVRWLNQSCNSSNEDNFEWVLLTVMNAPSQLPCDYLENPQSQPICIIRRLYETEDEVSNFKTSAIAGWQATCLETAYKALGQVRKGGFEMYQIVQSVHLALDQGKSYLIEYLAHVLHYLIELLGELGYLTDMEDIHCMDQANRKNAKKAKRCYKRSNIPSVKVYDDKHTWTVPLLRKNFKEL